MKILYFNDFRLGILNGQNVVDVTDVVQDIPHTGPHNLIIGLIERFARLPRQARRRRAEGQRRAARGACASARRCRSRTTSTAWR